MKKLFTAMVAFAAVPAAAQTLNPLQQYLYNESGYAPPQLAQPAPPQPVTPYTTAYAPPAPPSYYYPNSPASQPQNAAPEGYYEDEGSDVGPSSDNSSLRGMLTSSGF